MLKLTIELIFELSPTCQLDTFRHLAGQEHLQEETEGIVAQSPQSHLGIIEPCKTHLRPADFAFQLIEGQSGWVQQ